MFRLSAHADPAFLAEMLYEAVNWHDDGAEERPALDAVLAVPEERALRRRLGPGGRCRDVRPRPHATNPSARCGCADSPRPSPATAMSPTTSPSSRSGCSRSSAASRSARCCWVRSSPGPNATACGAISLSVQSRESCETPVRAVRFRGRGRARRQPHHAPRPAPDRGPGLRSSRAPGSSSRPSVAERG